MFLAFAVLTMLTFVRGMPMSALGILPRYRCLRGLIAYSIHRLMQGLARTHRLAFGEVIREASCRDTSV